MKASSPKIQRRHISGVFLLNKPLGISSNAALQKYAGYIVRKSWTYWCTRSLGIRSLPICLGEATKFSHYLLDSTKRYQTTVFLGHSTTTGDVEGEILLEKPVPKLNEELIQETIAKFVGEIQQVPPMYSALKKKVVRCMSWHVRVLKLNVKHVQLPFMQLSFYLLLKIALRWM